MGDYATRAELTTRFGAEELIQLTDRTNIPPTTIDDDVIAEATGDANSVVDGYLAAKYALPLSDVPASVVKAACDIARAYLHGDHASELIVKAREQAVAWLRDVATGKVQLSAAGTEVSSDAEPSFDGPERVFSRDSTKGF